MKLLCLDYGTKTIGLAITNQAGNIAFPFTNLKNSDQFINKLKKNIKQNQIEKIIIGLPKYKKNTKFYQETKKFIQKLKNNKIPIITQDELLTSQAAKKITDSKLKNRHDLAAMLILQDYLAKN